MIAKSIKYVDSSLKKEAPVPSIGRPIPLSMADPMQEMTILSVRGRDDVRHFLSSLGFVEGAVVQVVSEMGGNLIVNVKDTRVAINKTMASRILAV